MNDETFLKTLKNGVMIAGHEMGPVGDHWPAIQAINKGLDKEFEQHYRSEAVVGELEFHLAHVLRELEDIALLCEPKERKELQGIANELWQKYYAIFEPIDPKYEPDPDDLLEETGRGKHLRAALKILKDLGVTL